MYNVYLDNELLYSTAQTDANNFILNPMLNLEVNKAGFFSFVMPPDHALYEQITKLKSVVTVEQDGTEIFRGRVLNDETDFFNQKTVYCEGEMCYFLDSLQPPCEFNGTAMGLLQQLIDNHNNAVEEEKQFNIGTVTAFEESQEAQIEVGYYADTLSELSTRMLGAYGGYFRIRHENGKRYLDYLADTDTGEQPIEFGVNLLDLQQSISAKDVFTVLIPLGASQQDKDGEPLDITSVNDGLNYIENTEAVAKYGRIWRTQTWNYIDDPARLLAKAQEYMATGIDEDTTFVIKAVDMHFVNPATAQIRNGDKVRIVSEPHGIQTTIICYKQDIDLCNPENTQYTFGKPLEALTDNAVLAKKKLGGGGGGAPRTIEEEIKEWNTWADMFEDDATAQLQLTTGAINIMNGNSTGADIDLNGVVPLVKLSAHTQDMDTVNGRIDQTESSILINAEGIKAKVDRNGVIGAINLSPEEAIIQAEKINLQGYVTASELDAKIASFDYVAGDLEIVGGATIGGVMYTGGLNVESLNVTIGDYSLSASTLTMGDLVSKTVLGAGGIDLSHSHAVTVNDDGTITLGEVSATGGNFKIADTKAYKDGVSAAKRSVGFASRDWEGGYLSIVLTNDVQTRVYLTQGNATDANKIPVLDASSGETAYTVDASGVYNDGYAAGWAAAVAMCSVEITGTYQNVITVKMPSSTVDAAASDDVFTITSGVAIDNIVSRPGNAYSVDARGYAYVKRNDESRKTVSTSSSSKTNYFN